MSRPPNTMKIKYNGLTVYVDPTPPCLRFTSNVVKDCLMLVEPSKECDRFTVAKRWSNQQTYYENVYHGTEEECMAYILETLTRRTSAAQQ